MLPGTELSTAKADPLPSFTGAVYYTVLIYVIYIYEFTIFTCVILLKFTGPRIKFRLLITLITCKILWRNTGIVLLLDLLLGCS